MAARRKRRRKPKARRPVEKPLGASSSPAPASSSHASSAPTTSGLALPPAAVAALRSPHQGTIYVNNISGDVQQIVQIGEIRFAVENPSNRPTPAQLPRVAPGFTDRDDELAAVLDLADDSSATKVATIDGIPGCGKSAFAVRCGSALADAFPAGQLYASMTDANGVPIDLGLILDGFLLALHVRAEDIPMAENQKAAMFRSYLAQQRLLVLLDDCPPGADYEALISPGSRSMLITTSREPAAVPAAMRIALGEFTRLDSVRYLRTMAPDEELESLEEIAALCSDLPLALNAAGSRLHGPNTLTAGDLAKSLRSEGAALDSLERVRAAFRLSVKALTLDEVRALTVFGVTPEPDVYPGLVAGLLGLTPESADRLLEALASKRIITRSAGAHRYGTHRLMRIFARELADLTPEGAAALERRMLEYMSEAARFWGAVLFTSGRLEPPRELESSPRPEPREMLERARAFFSVERVRLVALQELALRNGEYEQVILLQEGLTAHWLDGGWVPALVERSSYLAVEAASLTADGGLALEARGNAIMARFQLGAERQGLLRDLESHLSDARAAGRRDYEALDLEHIAITLADAGEHQRAVPFAVEALRLQRAAANERSVVRALNTAGMAYLGLARLPTAAACLEAALRMWASQGDELGEASASANLGRVAMARGDYGLAAQLLRNALTTFSTKEARASEARARWDLAFALAGDRGLSAWPIGAVEELGMAVTLARHLPPDDGQRVTGLFNEVIGVTPGDGGRLLVPAQPEGPIA